MEKSVLLVTGDPAYREEFERASSLRHIVADYANSMEAAFELLAKNDYLLLDICADNVNYLPELKIVHQFREMPILVYSYNDSNDQVIALQNGAQVFLATQTGVDGIIETSAAMAQYYKKVKQRRHHAEPTLLTHGNLHMGVETHEVFINGNRVLLSKKEFDLLHYLIINKGLLLSYEQIYNNVWGWNADISYDSHNLLHSLVRRLRKKMQATPDAKGYITSVWEMGYKFGS